MGLILKAVYLSVLVAVIGILSVKFAPCCLFKVPDVPKLQDEWWGSGDPARQDKSIRPFKISFPEKDIQDLQNRLESVRPLTPPLQGIQQQYGMNTNLLKTILNHWKTKYNYQEREKHLNKYPQFKTNIQGLDIHYIHVKPQRAANVKVLPLLLLHGWPGSVVEFYDIIPLLTKPQNGETIVFEVVVPSLPGFGFSHPAVRPGLGAGQIALVFKNLMERLGYDKYYVQGGDYGAIITRYMAVMYPDKVLGLHSNMCVVHTPWAFTKLILGSVYPKWLVREEHLHRVYPLSNWFAIMLRESGYLHIQATKPDTIGVGLNESPAGLAAYIIEKFVTGSGIKNQLREDGGLTEKFTYDQLIDNLMVYWITKSATTAARLYAETFNKKHASLQLERLPIKVPSACARFESDFYVADGVVREIYVNLLQLSDYDGGHFAAFEVPYVLAKDIYSAVHKFEEWNNERSKKVQ